MTSRYNQSIIVPMTRITMANQTTSYEHTRNILEWIRTVTALLILAMQIVILVKLFGG